ncbi:MAG TPA: hypothetical protein VIK77_01905, partial [Tissierellaceae bacterium]
MFKIYTNLTNDKRIIVDYVFLKENCGNLANSYCEEGDSKLEVYAIVQLDNFTKDDHIGEAYLLLPYQNTTQKCNFRLYEDELRDPSAIRYATVPRISSGALVVDHVPAPNTVASSHTIMTEYLCFNITRLVRKAIKYQTYRFYVRIVNDATTKIKLLKPHPDNHECVIAQVATFKINGLNPAFCYEDQDLGYAGISKINLYTGKQVLANEFLATSDSKLPITVSLIFNQVNSEKSIYGLFGIGAKASFEYNFTLQEKTLEMIDPSDNSTFFEEITLSKAKNNYRLDLPPGYEGKVYYNHLDGSYALYDKSLYEIVIYDKHKNKMEFEYKGGKTLIKAMTNAEGDKIQFTKNSKNQIELIEKNKYNSEIVRLLYNESNRISAIRLEKERKLIEFSYLSSRLISLNVYNYRLEYSSEGTKVIKEDLLGGAKYSYSNRKLVKAYDTLSGFGCEFAYDGSEKVKKVTEFADAGTSLGEYVEFEYSEQMTVRKNTYGEANIYYFDHYGRNRLIMDQDGKTVSYNYDEIKDSISSKLIGQSNVQLHTINMLENHSFDADDDVLDYGSGWLILKGEESIVKTEYGGVFGEKYLSIDKAAGETVAISQAVMRPRTGTSILTGFIKYQGIDSPVSNGNIEIEVIAKYKMLETTYTASSSSSGSGGTKVTNEVSYKKHFVPTAAFIGESDWKPFTINNIYIPSGAYDLKLEVLFKLTGNRMLVGIDDLQLSLGSLDQKVRYNFVENGYMEFHTASQPKFWDFEGCNYGDIAMITEEASVFHKENLGEKVVKIKGTFGTDKKMKQIIPMRGNAGEELIFSVFSKAFASHHDHWYAYLKIHYPDIEEEPIYKFNFDKTYANWQVLTRSVVAEYPFDSVEVGVVYNGYNYALFDAIQLYKDNYGKYYNYDEKGNLIEVANSVQDSSTNSYDEDNNIKEISSPAGDTFKLTYDHKKRVKTVSDIEGNVVTYDYNDKDNIVTTKVKTKENKTLTTVCKYDDKDNPVELTDEHGNKTTNTFDSLNRLKKSVAPNGLVSDFNYNKYGDLINIVCGIGENRLEGNFDYDHKGQITKITTANGTVYNFTYDSFGNLKQVYVNNNLYVDYKYKLIQGINSGLLESKKYGENGTYTFQYDKKRRLEKVRFNGRLLVAYKYNEMDLVSELYDAENEITKYFNYDKKGNLIQETDGTNSIRYAYDNLENPQKVTYKIGDDVRDFDFEYKYEYNEYNKDGYVQRLDKAFMDDIIVYNQIADGKYGTKQIEKTASSGTIDNIKTFKFSTSLHTLSVDLKKTNSFRKSSFSRGNNFSLYQWNNKFKENKGFFFWIKPTGEYEERRIITLSCESSLKEAIFIDTLEDGRLRLGGQAQPDDYIYTENTLMLDEWNLIGLNIEGSGNNLQVLLHLNEDSSQGVFTKTYTPEGENSFKILEKIDCLTIGKFEAKHDIDGSSYNNNYDSTNLTMPYYIFLIGLGAFKHTVETFIGIYNEGIRYLSPESQVFENPSSGVIYYNHDLYDDFDVISLNGTFESRRGNKPISYTYTESSFKVDKTKLFKMDETLVYSGDTLSHKIRKHVFGSYNGLRNLTPGNKAKLIYDLSLRDKGSVFVKIKPEALEINPDFRYILSFQDNDYIKLGLAINAQSRLSMIRNGIAYDTGLVVEMDKWQTVGIRYEPGQIVVNLDKQTKVYNYQVDLTGTLTAVGMKTETGVPKAHLNGVLEMLSYTKQKVADAVVNKIVDEGEAIIVRKTYDFLGRVKANQILIGNKQIKTDYVYEDPSSTKLETLVNQEIQNDGTTINYEYDSVGNITKKVVLKEGI